MEVNFHDDCLVRRFEVSPPFVENDTAIFGKIRHIFDELFLVLDGLLVPRFSGSFLTMRSWLEGNGGCQLGGGEDVGPS